MQSSPSIGNHTPIANIQPPGVETTSEAIPDSTNHSDLGSQRPALDVAAHYTCAEDATASDDCTCTSGQAHQQAARADAAADQPGTLQEQQQEQQQQQQQSCTQLPGQPEQLQDPLGHAEQLAAAASPLEPSWPSAGAPKGLKASPESTDALLSCPVNVPIVAASAAEVQSCPRKRIRSADGRAKGRRRLSADRQSDPVPQADQLTGETGQSSRDGSAAMQAPLLDALARAKRHPEAEAEPAEQQPLEQRPQSQITVAAAPSSVPLSASTAVQDRDASAMPDQPRLPAAVQQQGNPVSARVLGQVVKTAAPPSYLRLQVRPQLQNVPQPANNPQQNTASKPAPVAPVPQADRQNPSKAGNWRAKGKAGTFSEDAGFGFIQHNVARAPNSAHGPATRHGNDSSTNGSPAAAAACGGPSAVGHNAGNSAARAAQPNSNAASGQPGAMLLGHAASHCWQPHAAVSTCQTYLLHNSFLPMMPGT